MNFPILGLFTEDFNMRPLPLVTYPVPVFISDVLENIQLISSPAMKKNQEGGQGTIGIPLVYFIIIIMFFVTYFLNQTKVMW